MFSDSKTSIEVSNKKQGAAFCWILNKFVLKCCVKDGWRLHGVLQDMNSVPADADAQDFEGVCS